MSFSLKKKKKCEYFLEESCIELHAMHKNKIIYVIETNVQTVFMLI